MELLDKHMFLILILLAFWGLLQCLYGYKLLLLIIALQGFLTGVVVGGVGGYMATEGNMIIAIVAAFFAGIITAYGAIAKYYLNIFTKGFFLTGGLVLLFCYLHQIEFNWPVIIVVGSIGGAIAVAINKFAVIVNSSVVGGFLLLLPFFYKSLTGVGVDFNPELLEQLPDLFSRFKTMFVVYGVFWVVISTVSIFIQYEIIPFFQPFPEPLGADQLTQG